MGHTGDMSTSSASTRVFDDTRDHIAGIPLARVCRHDLCRRLDVHVGGPLGDKGPTIGPECVVLAGRGRTPKTCAQCAAAIPPKQGARCGLCGWDRAIHGDPRSRAAKEAAKLAAAKNAR